MVINHEQQRLDMLYCSPSVYC